ncbi:YdcF family protein [Gordonia sp. CPCC 206044]|uniref:YdcF family protein n=1 Tax=Gordonia sp. CPCC 206044 TaxID=3140793 RepID=UPI003AF3DD59
MALILTVLALLVLSTVISAWKEPRRVRPGVYLTATMVVGVVTVVLVVARVRGDELSVGWHLAGVAFAGLAMLTALAILLIGNGVTLIHREGRQAATLVPVVVGASILVYAIGVAVGLGAGRLDSDAPTVVLVALATIGLPVAYAGFVMVAVVSWSIVYGWWGHLRAERDTVAAVIVLGAGLLDGRRVGPLLASRLALARRVHARSAGRGRRPLIVCSGGRGDDEAVSEASAMRDHLLDAGVDDDVVVLEERSTDTAENVALSARVLAAHGVTGTTAVVTSNYHALRAATMMRAAELDGFSTGARTAAYFLPAAELREVMAVVRDNLWLNVTALVVGWVPWVAAVCYVALS